MFTLVVKNGNYDYYTSKKIDQKNEYDSLAEAVAEFLYAVETGGESSKNKVTLTYRPSQR